MTVHSHALATPPAVIASTALIARTSQLFRQRPADRPIRDEAIDRLGRDVAQLLASDRLLIVWHRDHDATILFADGCSDPGCLRDMQRCADWASLGQGLPNRWFADECDAGDLLTSPVATSLGPISVTVLFNRVDPAASDVRREKAAHVLPLLHSFLSLWSERFTSSQRLHGLAAALDKGDVGVALVGRDGRLIFANVAAETLMIEADGIRQVNGVLCGTRLADTLRLQAAVEHVIMAETSHALRSTASPVLALPRRTKRPLMAAVVACDDDVERRDDPMAIVYLFDPEEDLRLLIEPVCKLYGLSPVETRLACLLADGISLGDAAERMHVREQTARSYLKQIFLKTDTNRQAELVWLMLKSSVRTAPGCRIALI